MSITDTNFTDGGWRYLRWIFVGCLSMALWGLQAFSFVTGVDLLDMMSKTPRLFCSSTAIYLAL